MNRLQAIRPFGQRIWLDNLSRDLLHSGELSRWIREDGIAGVTSNPAIFHKAIRDDARYATALLALKALPDLDAEQRYEQLVIPDIQAACDLLLDQYRASGGDDGYVSLEVSPELAHDEAGTLNAARRLWQEIDRPNAMIKVPATAAGVAALTTLIHEGINVNITLLFSLAQVEATWAAHEAGLRARLADGLPVGQVRSVASFFLSRIDSLLDGQLPEALRGKTAVALARDVYARWQARLDSPAWQALSQAGAQPQWLLWASTGTKSPAYSDVLYVESLIGPRTVNTVPDATLLAFRDHGQAADTLSDPADSQAVLAGVAAAGVDVSAVGEQLQRDGLKLFDEAFAALLALTA